MVHKISADKKVVFPSQGGDKILQTYYGENSKHDKGTVNVKRRDSKREREVGKRERERVRGKEGYLKCTG